MSTYDKNNQQTRDGTSVSDNVNQTPATNVFAVNADANTAALNDFKKMFTAFSKNSEEHDKVMSTLAKQVKILTARTRAVLPRRNTRFRGRKLDFATPLDKPEHAQGNKLGQNADEVTPIVTRKDSENLSLLISLKLPYGVNYTLK